jgi:hypothetical protein
LLGSISCKELLLFIELGLLRMKVPLTRREQIGRTTKMDSPSQASFHIQEVISI